MTKEIINFEKIEIIKATPEILENLEFDCGDEELNEFLLKDYVENLESKISVIYLCKHEEKILGFFSLSADSIKINENIQPVYKYYPAIKIGRLGIQKEYHNMKLGSTIIDWVVGFSKELQQEIGIRFISVDAYNKDIIIKFYEKNYFRKLKCKRTITIPMYKDLEVKEELI